MIKAKQELKTQCGQWIIECKRVPQSGDSFVLFSRSWSLSEVLSKSFITVADIKIGDAGYSSPRWIVTPAKPLTSSENTIPFVYGQT